MASDYIVSSGVTSSGITLGSGDPMEVLSGGSAVKTAISIGGVETVFSGGVTNLTTLSSGGVQDVSGSAASVIVEDGGSQVIEAGNPVVLISGFSHRSTEFATPYRVIDYHACNDCWNDPHHRFDHHDFLWCPRHARTPRQCECTRLIAAEQVKQTIRRIPDVGAPSRAKAGPRRPASARQDVRA
jgi:autotransporter passenger strand-loop-strand repeat protein